MARDKAAPEIRRSGSHKPLYVYTSETSHYSFRKNAAITGIGIDQVRTIPTNNKGVLIPEELEKAIKNDLKTIESLLLLMPQQGQQF